jgi:hypothetical protein
LTLALLAVWTWKVFRTGRVERAFLLFAVATGGFGLVGMLGVLLTETLLVWFRKTATPFEAWYEALLASSVDDPVETVVRQIRRNVTQTTGASTVAPFADVMTAGSFEQKCAVVRLMAEHFRPGFAPAFKMALSDGEPAVRIHATAAMAQLDNNFTARALALEEQRGQGPERLEHLLELARHYDAYAHSGLLDGERRDDARGKALEYYEAFVRVRPDDHLAAHEMTRLLVRLQRYPEALERLQPLVERLTASAETLGWYFESLYQLRRFTELRCACARFRWSAAGSKLNEGAREAVLYWSGDASPRATTAGVGA